MSTQIPSVSKYCRISSEDKIYYCIRYFDYDKVTTKTHSADVGCVKVLGIRRYSGPLILLDSPKVPGVADSQLMRNGLGARGSGGTPPSHRIETSRRPLQDDPHDNRLSHSASTVLLHFERLWSPLEDMRVLGSLGLRVHVSRILPPEMEAAVSRGPLKPDPARANLAQAGRAGALTWPDVTGPHCRSRSRRPRSNEPLSRRPRLGQTSPMVEGNFA